MLKLLFFCFVGLFNREQASLGAEQTYTSRRRHPDEHTKVGEEGSRATVYVPVSYTHLTLPTKA